MEKKPRLRMRSPGPDYIQDPAGLLGSRLGQASGDRPAASSGFCDQTRLVSSVDGMSIINNCIFPFLFVSDRAKSPGEFRPGSLAPHRPDRSPTSTGPARVYPPKPGRRDIRNDVIIITVVKTTKRNYSLARTVHVPRSEEDVSGRCLRQSSRPL